MCGDEWLLLWLYRRGRSGRPEKMCGDDGLLANVCILVGYVLLYMAGPSVGCSPRVFRGAVCTVKLYEHYIACISYYSDSTWVGVSLRTIHGATRQRQQGQRFVLVKGEEVTSSPLHAHVIVARLITPLKGGQRWLVVRITMKR